MLERGREFLERKGVGEARLVAELLVAHALDLDRLGLFLALERPVVATEVERARGLLVRRAAGVPTAYLRGEREFYGRPFRVGPGVLIPRPETELLVDLARERLADRAAPVVFDLGTGSGCVAITLALEVKGARVLASDSSRDALLRAEENAGLLGAEVELLHGEGLAPLPSGLELDLLVSNPPYVDRATAGELAPEVREHEPAEALFAPPGDPDHWVRRLLVEGFERLRPGGTLLVELGHDQADRVRALAGELGREVRLHRDLAGVERALEARREA